MRYIAISLVFTVLHVSANIADQLYQVHNAVQGIQDAIEHISQPAFDPDNPTESIINYLKHHNHVFLQEAFPNLQPNEITDAEAQEAINGIFSPISKNVLHNQLKQDGIIEQEDLIPDETISYKKRYLWSLTQNYKNLGRYIEKVSSTKPFPQFQITNFTPAPQQNSFINNVFLSIGSLIAGTGIYGPNQYPTKITKNMIQQAQNTYTIYLMPKPEELINTISSLIRKYNQLNKDKRFIKTISFHTEMKFVLNKQFNREALPYEEDFWQRDKATINRSITYILPQITIQLVENKESVEKTMKWLMDIFKNQEGINIYPRFSKKVTSLIYYTQGTDTEKEFITQQHLSKAQYAFDPKTDYVFLYTDAFTEQQKQDLGFNSTQKLINRDTGKSFGEE